MAGNLFETQLADPVFVQSNVYLTDKMTTTPLTCNQCESCTLGWFQSEMPDFK